MRGENDQLTKLWVWYEKPFCRPVILRESDGRGYFTYGLTGLFPSIQNSKFKTPKLKIAIIKHKTNLQHKHLPVRYSLRDCHNNPPHQLVSSYMQVVTCTMGITLEYVFIVKHASGHKTREQLRYASKVQTLLFMLNYCCCRNVLKSSPPLSHYY